MEKQTEQGGKKAIWLGLILILLISALGVYVVISLEETPDVDLTGIEDEAKFWQNYHDQTR